MSELISLEKEFDEGKFIKGFIENLEKNLMNRSFSLSLTLMDTSDEARIGASHYPLSIWLAHSQILPKETSQAA